MDGMARLLIIGGITIVIIGVLLLGAGRLGIGRLPGDIAIEGENARVYIPIVSMIVLSLVLTVVLNVVLRIWR
jgi:hypothetical protein